MLEVRSCLSLLTNPTLLFRLHHDSLNKSAEKPKAPEPPHPHPTYHKNYSIPRFIRFCSLPAALKAAFAFCVIIVLEEYNHIFCLINLVVS